MVRAVTVMRGKNGIEVSLLKSTSELWATLLEIRPAPVHASAHIITQGDTGVWAGVVRAIINMLTVFVGVMTLEAAVTVVTGRGHGHLPTFTADNITTPPGLSLCATLV